MPEQLSLPLTIRRCPPSLAETMRQRYLTVMADLATQYGVKRLTLVFAGAYVRLEGPRGGCHAEAPRGVLPAQPMPAVTDPRWYSWSAQAALWVHRSRGCRGCGKRGKTLFLNRFGHCPDCVKEARYDSDDRQGALTFGRKVKGVTTTFKGVKKAPRGLRRVA